MSALTELMERHTITLVPGVPDYYKIRMLETEIYEAPITQYSGEWDDISNEDHYKRRHFRYGLTGHERCMWCEDARRKSKITQAEVRADMDRAAGRTRVPLIKRLVTPYRLVVVFAVAWITTIACMAVWG